MYSSYIFKRITQDLICRLCMHKLYETKTENKGLYCQHIDSASRRKQGSTAINKMRVKKAQQLMISKSRLFPDFQSILLIFQTFSSLKSCVSNSRLFPDFQTSVRTLNNNEDRNVNARHSTVIIIILSSMGKTNSLFSLKTIVISK